MGSDIKGTTGRSLNQLLVDEMDVLVRENFAGVEAEWWWERPPDGGVTVCQELDPEALTGEMAEIFGLERGEIRQIAVRTLGLEDFDPVVLVYELSGDTSAERADGMLAERSSTTAGISEGIYHQLAQAIQKDATPQEGE